MKNPMAASIPLAIVLLAAVAAVALRAAARGPEPRPGSGTEPASVTVQAGESRPRPAVTTGPRDGTGHEVARPPGLPASAIERTQHVFHELHADGRNALCAV